MGGGCYGSFYASQLLRARARGAVDWRRLLWWTAMPNAGWPARSRGKRASSSSWTMGRFFDRHLGAAATGGAPDAIVPSPLMPHLMYEWLVRRARRRWPGRTIEPRPVPLGPGTPYDLQAPDDTVPCLLRRLVVPDALHRAGDVSGHPSPADVEKGRGPAAPDRTTGRGPSTAGPVLFTCCSPGLRRRHVRRRHDRPRGRRGRRPGRRCRCAGRCARRYRLGLSRGRQLAPPGSPDL